MIFAVCQQNIRTLPKVISLLGRMRVIVALPPKRTPRQCFLCWEWSHKKENCAKKLRCFICSSNKHEAGNHVCMKEKCKDGATVCPHPPKCIICNGPHEADFNHCPLKPLYSKLKGATKSISGPNVSQIRG